MIWEDKLPKAKSQGPFQIKVFIKSFQSQFKEEEGFEWDFSLRRVIQAWTAFLDPSDCWVDDKAWHSPYLGILGPSFRQLADDKAHDTSQITKRTGLEGLV